ncbi:TetR/AcrR family transcriptional regulator [Auraticoccus monumenti]|uniref:DNA-binding transcriptional regulator, AcrR family n=1 Tax=Auraticoccus monumenti TaxID=675864 RepID=A0A1G6V5P4_9ACTN|nr:TetR/AcrR family transcriptional regulator [Auraticoccus monumenti]SDD48912.1 DNA-binding transcriptional regulator, AcrR family [Auraticoccus monumenti]
MATYHHGDLRAAVLRRVAEVVLEQGPSAVSLRSVASDLGVSHTAPRHHFGSLRGVFTALAAEGFTTLARDLAAVRLAGGSFLDAGVGYVAFATAHPAHFQVMFTPALCDPDDPALASARQASFAELERSARGGETSEDVVALTAWSAAHGLATLLLTGNLQDARWQAVGATPAELARSTLARLFDPAGTDPTTSTRSPR